MDVGITLSFAGVLALTELVIARTFTGVYPATTKARDFSELTTCLLYHIFIVVTLGSYWIRPPVALSSDRIYGTDPTVGTLLLCSAGMELWNCAYEMSKPSTPSQSTMVVHHSTAFLHAYLAATGPVLYSYACFYMGITSISNIFYCMFYYFRTFPALKTNWPVLYGVVQTSFGVVFLLVRGIWWFWVSAYWWADVIPLLTDDRCPFKGTISLFMVGNVVISYMQMMWCAKIVNKIIMGGGVRPLPHRSFVHRKVTPLVDSSNDPEKKHV